MSYEDVFCLKIEDVIKCQLELAKQFKNKTVGEIITELLEQLRNAKDEKELRIVALKLFELGTYRGALASDTVNSYWNTIKLVAEIFDDLDSVSKILSRIVKSNNVEVMYE